MYPFIYCTLLSQLANLHYWTQVNQPLGWGTSKGKLKKIRVIRVVTFKLPIHLAEKRPSATPRSPRKTEDKHCL